MVTHRELVANSMLPRGARQMAQIVEFRYEPAAWRALKADRTIVLALGVLTIMCRHVHWADVLTGTRRPRLQRRSRLRPCRAYMAFSRAPGRSQ
jgi:hypothetical protein